MIFVFSAQRVIREKGSQYLGRNGLLATKNSLFVEENRGSQGLGGIRKPGKSFR